MRDTTFVTNARGTLENMDPFNFLVGASAIIGAICAYLAFFYNHHRKELEKDAELRKRKVGDLRNPRFANIYGRWLDAVLNVLSAVFGKRYFSFRAIGACIGISLIYSSALFLISWTLGGPSKIGATDFIGVDWDWPPRLLAFAGLVTPCGVLYLVGKRLGRVDRAVAQRFAGRLPPWLDKRSLPLASALIAALIIGAFFSVFLLSGLFETSFFPILYVFSVAATYALVFGTFDAVIGNTADTVGAATAIAGAGSVATVLFIGVLTVAILALARDASITLTPPNVSTFLFMLLLPVLNGILDALSWWVSRRLGRHLSETFKRKVSPVKRTLIFLWHILADLVAALGLLALLAMLLTAAVEGVNMLAAANGLPPPLLLDEFLKNAKNDPWGGNGIWITLMLLSTLVPTLGHFVMVVAGSGLRLWPESYRMRLADGLDGKKPVQSALRGAAWHSTLNWVASGLIVLFVGGLLLWGIATFWAPLSDLLYWLAQETLTQIGGPSAPGH